MKINDRERNFLARVSKQMPLPPINRWEDKARQRMRRLGYVEFMGKPKRWHITDAGRKALENIEEME